jgi:hypothetical protein
LALLTFIKIRGDFMKIAKILSLTCVIGGCAAVADCQVYSGNIVGYINQTLYAGDNYIANQLSNSNNTLNAIFQTGVVPEGTTFTEWDPATQQFLPSSTYDTVNGWSIDYTLTYGQGGLLDAPSTFVNTFTGSVWPGFDAINNTFTPPLVTANGSLFLSCFIPISDATFYDVVGRGPQNGESVTFLDAATQTYTTTTFDDGSWNNGDPSLDIGEAAFFNLEPVPEPAVCGLLGIGLAVLMTVRRFFSAKGRRAG